MECFCVIHASLDLVGNGCGQRSHGRRELKIPTGPLREIRTSRQVAAANLESCPNDWSCWAHPSLQTKIANHLGIYADLGGDTTLFRVHESHSLILLGPAISNVSDEQLRYNSRSWTRRVITPTIAVRLAQSAAFYSQTKASWVYKLLLGHPSTASAAGWVFEAKGSRRLP